MTFTHLHCKSHYSFLGAAMSPKGMVNTAKAAGFDAIALTDSGNMCAMVEFSDACKGAGIRPIFGVELWTCPDGWRVPLVRKKGAVDASQTELIQSAVDTGKGKKFDHQAVAPGYQLVLLVENDAGYDNLCALITMAHRQRNYVPRIEPAQLALHAEGLFCLTSTRHGPVGVLDDPAPVLEELKEIYGDHLFVELSDWGLDGDQQRNTRAIALAQELDIELVVTNECLYTEPEGSVLIDVLHSIATGVSQSDHLTDQAWLKGADEMSELFPHVPRAIENSFLIADRCRFSLRIGETFLPDSEPPGGLTIQVQWEWFLERFPPSKNFSMHLPVKPPRRCKKGESMLTLYFESYCRAGLKERLRENEHALLHGTTEEYTKQIDYEMGVICSKGYAAYHLIVAEFISWAKENGIPMGPGRGSAAGAVVTWAMCITDVNPLQFGLMFERFLNPKRDSMPDIDIDIGKVGRDAVIAHVREKYGNEQVGQILTIGTMKAKAALKDCARAIGVHFLDADTWSKQIEEGPKASLSCALEDSKMLRELYENDPKFRRVADLAMAVEGRPRQTGVHAAGVIITSKPIMTVLPLHCEFTKGEQDESVVSKQMTCVEMNAAEKLGLVKFDFLGLKTLDIIEEARDLVEEKTGTRPEPVQLSFDDPGVFELLTAGDTLGLFQLESHGMQNLLRKMKPDNMEDIVATLALYRPGPLGSGMVEDYVECKHGRAEIRYPHELLEEVLKPTYGVFVYQEQILAAVQVLAGYDLGSADLLRRAVGKKKPAEMVKQRKNFVYGNEELSILGCIANGISESKANEIFDLIDYFSGYGFNKTVSETAWVLRAGRNASMETPWIQIKDIVKLWNGEGPDGPRASITKKMRAGRLNLIQMDPDGRCRPGRLVGIHDHGVKPVFSLVTECGVVTPPMSVSHRIMTPEGYSSLDTGLAIGNEILLMGENSRKSYSSWWIGGDAAFSQQMRCNDQYRRVSDLVWTNAFGKCEICGIAGEKRRGGHEVAHRKTPAECDYDIHRYHVLENLHLLCNSCHKLLDYGKGERTKRWQKGRPTYSSRISEIRYVGEHHCYDLEMNTEGHNYVASSAPDVVPIISHNSHSASYAIITYATAWLKAHHRAELMASAMSWEASDRDKLVMYVNDCVRAGIEVLNPDLIRSRIRFSVETIAGGKSVIRYGLGAIKGVKSVVLRVLVHERDRRPFDDFGDFKRRVRPDKTTLQAMAAAGCFDSIGITRFEAWMGPERKSRSKKVIDPGQLAMFATMAPSARGMEELAVEDAVAKKRAAEVPWTFTDTLSREERVLGCWISGSPLDRFRDIELRVRTASVVGFDRMRRGRSSTLVGVITKIHKLSGNRGEWCYFTITDRLGMEEIVVRPAEYLIYKRVITKGRCVVVSGALDKDGSDGRFIVSTVEDLAKRRSSATRSLDMYLTVPECTDVFLANLNAILSRFEVGSRQGVSISIRLEVAHLDTVLELSLPVGKEGNGVRCFDPDPTLFEEIESLTRRPDALRMPGGGMGAMLLPDSERPSTEAT